MSLDRRVAAEGLSNAVTATLTRNTDTTFALDVSLSSSDTTEATVPAQVTIPAGAASVTFSVTSVADGITDGTQPVTILANASGFAGGSDLLSVTDQDLPDLVVREVTSPSTALTDTYADVSRLERDFGVRPQIAVEDGLRDFVDWFRAYRKL